MKTDSIPKDEIIHFCNSLGLDHVGLMKCRIFHELQPYYEYRKERGLENEFEEKDISKRINPTHYMAEAKTIISVAFPYFHADDGNGGILVDNGFSIYTRGLDYHRVVKTYLDKIANFLTDAGFQAMAFVDSNTLPERYIACMSGVGFIGRNELLITKKYGSFVFLGEILTDCKIETNSLFEPETALAEIAKFEQCGDCKLCYNNCKTKAICTSNPNICTSYLTQKKELTAKERKLLHGKVFGCDDCQLVCPYNKFSCSMGLQEFAPINSMNLPTEEYSIMTNKFFKEEIRKSSSGWRGKNVIKRNALIRLEDNAE